MQIFWDAYGLQSIYSGIGRYAWQLATSLQQLDSSPLILPSVPVDPVFAPFLVAPASKRRRLKPLALVESARLFESYSCGADVFHGLSNYNLPKLKGNIRKVLTIHDLIPFLDKSSVSWSLRAFLKFQLPKSIRYADLILCDSQWTKDSVEDFFPQARAKTAILQLGKPERMGPRKVSTSHKTLLTIARGEAYKRLELIPQILKQLPSDIRWFVVSDEKGVKALLERSGNDPRLKLFSAISDLQLREIWSESRLYVHPSLWEGYGLPIAEALTMGIPSLITSGSGADEVLGGAGLKLSPAANSLQWAEKIDLMLKEDWQDRCQRQWESLPSWIEVGKQLLGFYDKVK